MKEMEGPQILKLHRYGPNPRACSDGCYVLNKGLLRGAVATQSAFVIRT